MLSRCLRRSGLKLGKKITVVCSNSFHQRTYIFLLRVSNRASILAAVSWKRFLCSASSAFLLSSRVVLNWERKNISVRDKSENLFYQPPYLRDNVLSSPQCIHPMILGLLLAFLGRRLVVSSRLILSWLTRCHLVSLQNLTLTVISGSLFSWVEEKNINWQEKCLYRCWKSVEMGSRALREVEDPLSKPGLAQH